MKKKITCSYCEKKGHNIVTCALKKSDAKSFEGRFPQKYRPGDMIRFAPAPPRYPNCNPRSPGVLVNQLAIVISDVQEDYHNWGGIYKLVSTDGSVFSYHGDFMELTARAQ